MGNCYTACKAELIKGSTISELQDKTTFDLPPCCCCSSAHDDDFVVDMEAEGTQVPVPFEELQEDFLARLCPSAAAGGGHGNNNGNNNDVLQLSVVNMLVQRLVANEYACLVEQYDEVFHSVRKSAAGEIEKLHQECAPFENLGVLTQNACDVDVLLEQAERVLPKFESLLKKASFVSGDQCYLYQPKSRRAITLEKDPSLCVDIIRGSIICACVERITSVIGFLTCYERARFAVVRIVNGFASAANAGGYREVIVHVSLDDFICEIRVHLKAFCDVRKDEGQTWRNLEKNFLRGIGNNEDDDLKQQSIEVLDSYSKVLEDLLSSSSGWERVKLLEEASLFSKLIGDFPRALEFCNQLLSALQKGLPQTKFAFFRTIGVMADCYEATGDRGTAAHLDSIILEYKKCTLGMDHPSTEKFSNRVSPNNLVI
eukprot:TRINITY_DN15493_c0_g2_i6.p1 TRINITY_DN15493_c0_g2~~TRINITY_DN15493_c0_g2_i6.p1  ORF type:complete len:429 (+),score=116.78 TRINITY_DN15493_c0_g2_i6:142-1428(+)